MCESFTFCPICQLPLKAITISPELHVTQCMARCDESENEECPQGVHCLSTDVFHYRDFSHKLLAAYRSSSDFVPPEVEIRPSPKKRKTPVKPLPKRTPRKTRTPSKTKENATTTTSDSESDSDVLVQVKKPRRILKFSEENSSEADSVKSKSVSNKTSKRISPKKTTNSLSSAKTKANKSLSLAADKANVSPSRNNSNLTVLNVKLNAGEEVSVTNFRASSPLSSISVSTNTTSKVEDSDFESETSLESVKKQNIAPKSKFTLKQPVLQLSKISPPDDKSTDICKSPIVPEKNDETNNSANEGSDTNLSLSKTDFEEIIPELTLDKELIKTLDTKTIPSPVTTVHSCSEYTGGSATMSEDEGSDVNTKATFSDSPSSPEVIIPPKTRSAAPVLTSSSDSDVPLAALIKNRRPSDPKTKDVIKGKEKAGKVLRDLHKTPVYLNGSSLKSVMTKGDTNASSDKDSDSGKSSASKDASFVPSERSSSHHSDSAFSANSTDNLSPSTASTTYTSSEDNTYESRSSDPSYSMDSDENARFNSKIKTKNSPREKRGVSFTPKKTSKPLFLSESSNSDISMKEELIFGKKKSPHVIKSSKKIKVQKQNSTVNLHNGNNSDDKTEWQCLLTKMRTGSFPSDLKIDSEDSLTVASSCSGSDTSHSSMMLPPRQCPFYKRIPDTPFAVDAFQYWNIPGVKVYFLSHFHSDHYIGIKKNFSQPIYCTQVTANLVRMKLRVAEKWLHVLELDKPQVICGVEVTALDANHCPGSIMLLFSLTNGRSYLHVGDFRASRKMTMHPSLQRLTISKLFLDTTYCSPQYCFPTQEEVIRKVVDIVREQVKTRPRTLVVCGSYTIGKEKVFVGVAEALGWRVWARPEKQRVFTCLNDSRINSRLVKDPRVANVHVLPMASIQIRALQQHLESCAGTFTHVIGVKPTGWELNNNSQNFKITTRDNITIYGVPYSEHSSFSELRDFVQFLQPHEVVPTVNMGSAASRTKMTKYFSEWLNPPAQTAPSTQKKVSEYFKSSGS